MRIIIIIIIIPSYKILSVPSVAVNISLSKCYIV